MLKTNQINTGLLIIRIGLGIMFIMHGFPKVMGGPEKWEAVGKAISNIGITFAPAFWGLMAAMAEFAGGILMILGIFFRPAVLLLFITMIVAAIMHFSKGQGFGGYAHALESAIVFSGLFFTGPGKYKIGSNIWKR